MVIKDCALCFNDSYFSKKLSCSHHFCLNCISEWTSIKNNCPMCRKSVKVTSDMLIYRVFKNKLNNNLNVDIK